MTWLLSKPKGRRRTHKPQWQWERRHTMLALKVLGSVALAVAVVWAWDRGERALESYVSRHHAVHSGAQRVLLADGPDWMGQSIREQLQHLAADRAAVNPLAGHHLVDAAAGLERIAWVRCVRQVRRTGDGHLVVEADYRRPVAVVAGRDGYHLVDATCLRLPGLYLEHTAQRLGLPVIVGAANAAAEVGRVWPGEDLAAGVRLATLLAGEPYMDQVQAIDVMGRDPMGRVRLALRTLNGTVRWGLPPGEEHPIEPSAAVKKLLLARVAAEHDGLIDAGGHVVDIYDGNILLHHWSTTNGAVQTSYTH